MAKIMIAASNGIMGVPPEVSAWIEEYAKQGHTFIVGDHKTSDNTIHRAISAAGGAQNTIIYSLGEADTNTYKFEVCKFNTEFNEEKQLVTMYRASDYVEVGMIEGIQKEMDIPLNKNWYEFADRQMINDCAMAILIVSSDISKRMGNIIQRLNILGKPCYTFRVQ